MSVQLTSAADITVFVDGVWRTVSVPAEPKPKPRRRVTRPGRPVIRDGLSSELPFTESMTDTAFNPAYGGYTDHRTLRRTEPVMRTHRAATVWPAGNASDSAAGTRWHDLGR